MAQPRLLLYSDVLDSLTDFIQGHGIGVPASALRRAVLAAYREIITLHDWTWLHKNGRVFLHAAQTTGSVAYDHTGGTYERQLTLTGATWPSWVEDAAVRLDDIVCDVEQRKSSTVVTLDAQMNPGADVAAGTTYTLYPRWYILPADFLSMDRPLEEASWYVGEYLPMQEILQLDRYEETTGDILYHSFGPAQDLYGSMALYVHPPASADETFDFLYKRRPRDLRHSGHDTAETVGTIAVTAGSATVAGTNTTFASTMVGSILRIGTSATYRPTGLEGQYPWAEERSIIAVANATSLTLDANVGTSRSGVKYSISDPVDLDITAHDLFLRCCEKHVAHARNLENKADVERAFEEALFRAKCADSRGARRRIAGVGPVYVTRLADATNRPTDTLV